MDICPCNLCLVKAACNKKYLNCELSLSFMNNVPKQMVIATAADIKKYRMTTPLDIRKKVEKLMRTNTKYAYPENIKSQWSTRVPAHKK